MAAPFAPPLKSTPSASTSSGSITPTPHTTAQAAAPTVPPLHLAAQTGDLTTLAALLAAPQEGAPDAPTAQANDLDSAGISALHWAAINNHVLACKMLLEAGAEVDKVGGDLSATPLHWAARNGHLYIVHLLLKYSADPTLLDSQSFNALHLAVHSSSALLLAYLLFTSQPLAVDSSDPEGHTSLHWACYQGDSISVDLLLRAGADPRRADEAGLTPLHWAAVKGNSACIKKIVQAGVDMTAKEKLGKTAKDMATELKSIAAFNRGLVDAGYDEDGRKQLGKLSARNTILAIFAIPTITFFLVLNTLALFPWWSGVLLAAAEFFAMHHIVSKILLDIQGPHHSDRLTKSPYLCSIIVASIIWVTYVWLTRFLFGTPGYGFTNLFCGILIAACTYNFYRAITLDPGHVPRTSSDSELKETIEELVEGGIFNGMNFCLDCMVRRPLRSKHSFATKRCTARFDHYCPWVWNDVGVNNHRQFLLFVLTLVSAIGLFIRLSLAYFAQAPSPPLDSSCILPFDLCSASSYDTLALSIVFWSALQLSWTSVLLTAQIWQICRQMTTLEVSNVSRYGFMGGKPGVSVRGQSGLVEKWGRENPPGGTGGPNDHVHGPTCDHGPASGAKKSHFLLKILGVDRFLNGKAEGLAAAPKGSNPFDVGIWTNCRDFWSSGGELGVDYGRVYDVPVGGFKRALRDKKRAAGRRSAGYERVGEEDTV